MKKKGAKRSAQSPAKHPAQQSVAFPALEKAALLRSAGLLGVLVFVMFADVLLAPGSHVLGSRDTDMFLQFFSWRQFGFGELAKGNLALWNPHIYGGAPYFGGSQAAMLYPTNLLLLFLPLPLAINWSIAINVWLLGVFMYFWAAYRRLGALACFLAGVLIMFCGPHFMHVYAGHIVHTACMTWAPILFLAIDRIFDWSFASGDEVGKKARWKSVAVWSLAGMFAVAMQIFAGHPQYLFYTAIAAGIYSLLHFARALFFQTENAMRPLSTAQFAMAAVALAAIYAGGVALGAVQLLTSIQATNETIRSLPVPFEFAAMFGFPPENLLTLINPFLFGDMTHQAYWGRCYLWEMSLFFGVSGMVLAVYGAIYADKTQRRFSISLIVVTLILALGVHTPLFRVLYDWVPGFGKFRSISKFSFQSLLFLVMLAAIGFDKIARARRVERKFVVGVFAGAGVILCAAAVIWISSATGWRNLIASVLATQESYLPPQAANSLGFADDARIFSAEMLFISGVVALAFGALLHLVPTWPEALHILVALAVVETWAFAWHTRATFDSNTVVVPEVQKFLGDHPGDYRILNLLNPNSAMSIGAQDLWGFDPGVVRRYAEFVTWSQGGDPDKATQYVNFAKLDPLYAMLRLRFAFVPGQKGMQVAEAPTAPMPRVQLVPRYRMLQKRDAIFARMRESSFDPRREVILEKEPDPKPTHDEKPNEAAGTARVVTATTDALTIEADLPQPAILLITDAWTPAWRAVALPDSVQNRYDVQPADYVLRAVPLAAGHHHFRVEYAPRAFVLGKWISLVSAFGLAGCAVALFRGKRWS
jgi:hypothetical protein